MRFRARDTRRACVTIALHSRASDHVCRSRVRRRRARSAAAAMRRTHRLWVFHPVVPRTLRDQPNAFPLRPRRLDRRCTFRHRRLVLLFARSAPLAFGARTMPLRHPVTRATQSPSFSRRTLSLLTQIDQLDPPAQPTRRHSFVSEYALAMDAPHAPADGTQ